MDKRLFDIICSLVVMMVLPLFFVIIALVIKIDSPGPAFFRQERVGIRGKLFRIYKFRSMYVSQTSKSPEITVGNDRRITRVGSFLRKYKIDELPQFFNVLKGEMSLVGPRPEVPKYVAQYSDYDREIVLSVRPGITDVASVYFKNENDILGRESNYEKAYIRKILPKKLRYYRWYVQRHTICLDIKIILWTIRVIFS